MSNILKNLKSDFIILAIDITAASGSVCILKNFSLLAEITYLTEITHSKHLMNIIDSCLKLAMIDKFSDISGIAVTTGPGSFTGLRICLSTVKGLSYASKIPIVGIKSLKALASGIYSLNFLICTMMIARKDEVYFAGYKYEDSILKCKIEQKAGSVESMLQEVKEPSIFIGDGVAKYHKTISSTLNELANFTAGSFNIIRASSVAKLSAEVFLKDGKQLPANLKLEYIKTSDVKPDDVKIDVKVNDVKVNYI